MVYAINNRYLFRGFHPCLEGTNKITKPDGKVVKGRWISGALTTIPMPTPPGAAPQMPILCLAKAEEKMDSISSHTVCACTISLFSGTWILKDWDSLTKTVQQDWLKKGRKSSDWKGIPVFEGDIFYDRTAKDFYVVTNTLLNGFRLESPSGNAREWCFDGLTRKGCLWNPPKEFPADALAAFHKARNTEARVEEIRF